MADKDFWIKVKPDELGFTNTFVCSKCGKTLTLSYRVRDKVPYFFCPYCGSSMDHDVRDFAPAEEDEETEVIVRKVRKKKKYTGVEKEIRDENVRARNDWCYRGVKNLQVAICRQAVEDYKAALDGKSIDGKGPEAIIRECEQFFGTELFRTTATVQDKKKIIRLIKQTHEEEKARAEEEALANAALA